jgi:hypothetical protein
MKGFKIKMNFRLFLFFCLLFIVVVFLASIAVKKQITSNVERTSSIDKVLDNGKDLSPTHTFEEKIKEDKVVVTGVIRTTGLRPEEKEKLGLKFGNYQITDFGRETIIPEIRGFYLESSDLFSQRYLGMCVRVEGRLAAGPKEEIRDQDKINQYYYQAFAMIPENILPLEMTECSPYEERPLSDIYFEPTTFSGILKHGKRPAPDIGYDYILVLDEEYLDKDSAFGYPIYLGEIDIVPSNNDIWIRIQEKINQKVTLGGYYLWGYAESKFLEVREIF